MEREKVQPGDPIRAGMWNRLIDRVHGTIVGGDRRISVAGLGAARSGPRAVDLIEPIVVLVRVKLVASTADQHGDATTRCSYLYDVFPYRGEMIDDGSEDDTRIAIDSEPLGDRTDVGWYDFVPIPGEDFSFAKAFRDLDDPDEPGVWRLHTVDGEVEHTFGCDCTCNEP